MELFETINRLCTQTAPTGFEAPAIHVAKALLAPYVDTVTVDRLGNVIGVRRCGKPNAKRLLLDAHLDEVGFIVTGIDQGFLRFASLGDVDARMLPDQEVTIYAHDNPLFGVVACSPPHVQTAEEREKAVCIEDLRIDVGMDQKEVERVIPIGAPISYRQNLVSMNNGQICGKALDDRVCFVVLLRVLELLQDKTLDVDLYVMGSVREETSGAGAIVGTNAVQPDWCVAVDVTFARTPGLSEDQAPCKLYGGPAIGMGPSMAWTLTNRMIAQAKAQNIPYQCEVMERDSGTNGWEMETCLEGIPTSVISLPLKYMHSPVEVAALEDMENTAKLLAVFTEHLEGEGIAVC